MTQPRQTLRPPLRRVQEAYTKATGATYTAKAGDRVIGVNRAGTVTVTLPTAQLHPGRIYTVKDESGAAATNNITVATEGAETIDGSATDVINIDYESKSYYSDGTNWFILSVTPEITLSTTVSTQAHGDPAAPGSAATASKGDHKHAMPAAGGPTEANQSDMEDEGATNANRFVSAENAHFGPWAIKAWAKFDGTSADPITNDAAYNCDATTDVGTGDYTTNFTNDFSGSNYLFMSYANAIHHVDDDGPTAGAFNFKTLNSSHTKEDALRVWAMAAGDQ